MKKFITLNPVFRGTLLFIFLIASFFFQLSAQNILTLSNSKTGETHVFRKGSFVVFGIKADSSIHEGFIRGITDSSLMFDNAQVAFSQMDILAGSTKGRVVAGRIANGFANGLIAVGSGFFNVGLEFFSANDGFYYWPVGGTIWLGGAVIAGVGYLFDWATCPLDHAVRVRNYRGWNAAIVKEEEQIKQEKISIPTDSSQTVIPPAEEKPKKEKRKNKIADDVYGE
jgi:hypothetical protein